MAIGREAKRIAAALIDGGVSPEDAVFMAEVSTDDSDAFVRPFSWLGEPGKIGSVLEFRKWSMELARRRRAYLRP